MSTTAAIVEISTRHTLLTLRMATSGLGNRDIARSVLGQAFAMQQDAINRLQRLIRRFEHEMPSFSRAELDSMLTTVTEGRVKLAKVAVKAELITLPGDVPLIPKRVKNGAIQTALPTVHSEQQPELRPLPEKPIERTKRVVSKRINKTEAPAFGSVQTSAVHPNKKIAIVGAALVFLTIASLSLAHYSKDPQPKAQRTSDEREVRDAVEGWANAFRARDTEHFAAYYAPKVEQFFRKKDVSRSRIQETYLTAFGKMDNIYAYEISDLRVEFPEGEASPARATATYDKAWDTSQTNGTRNSGEEIERLTFGKTDEGWKIVREDELQVIPTSRK